MLCLNNENNDENHENIFPRHIERSLVITTPIDRVGLFPFHVIDMSSIQRALRQYFNVDIPSTFNPCYSTTDPEWHAIEEKIIMLELECYRYKSHYKNYEIVKAFTCGNMGIDIGYDINYNEKYHKYVCMDRNKNVIVTCPFGTVVKIGEILCLISSDKDLSILSLGVSERKELHRRHDYSLYTAFTYASSAMTGIHALDDTTDYFVTNIENIENVENVDDKDKNEKNEKQKLNHVSNFFNRKSRLSVITTVTYQDYVTQKMVKKGDLRVYTHEDYRKNKKKVISECMVGEPTKVAKGDGDDGKYKKDENTGLRFRGVYTSEMDANNSKILYKTLQKNDEYVYIKKGDDVLLNNVTEDVQKRDTEIIGWKVAENEYGEKRIVKLAILPDASIVRPVDEEFFHTKGKERCNKALVLDIQYPDEEKVESVVPHETKAYSYIFSSHSHKFEYAVGKEVTPDAFDDNENTSCTNGIHYYRDRKSVFDVYVNR